MRRLSAQTNRALIAGTRSTWRNHVPRTRSGFWARLAREHLSWHRPFTKVLDESNAPLFKWFDDGLLNASYNCLDRHLHDGNANKIAIIFEADDGTVTTITYRQLHARVCRLANGLRAQHRVRQSRDDLSADVDRRCRRDAGVRAHWRAAFGRVRSCSAASRRSRCTNAWSRSLPSPSLPPTNRCAVDAIYGMASWTSAWKKRTPSWTGSSHSISCLVFTFGSLLVAIEVAGATIHPTHDCDHPASKQRDSLDRRAIRLFIFSLLWTHRTMTEIGQTHLVPELQVLVATIVGPDSLMAFIVLIDYSARLPSPVALVGRIAEHGFAVIESIYALRLKLKIRIRPATYLIQVNVVWSRALWTDSAE
ncbi:hypothetical protein QFZ91_005444 [Paraburkholderia sp. JPY419]